MAHVTDGMSAEVSYGEVFTRRWVVDLMLDLSEYTTDRDLTALTVVEPSIGTGAFVGPIVERLLASRPAGQPWKELVDCLRGFDIQPGHVETCRRLTRSLLAEAGCPAPAAEQLVAAWFHAGDFLLSTKADLLRDGLGIEADLVIGNPPYIRIEDLDPALLASYRRVAPTMRGRADIFVGFYEHGLDLLREGARLAFICADRWARNSYGRALRAKITEGPFAVDTFLVMHDAPAFEADVSAYPAVTVIRRGPQRGSVTGTATERFDAVAAQQFVRWSRSGSESLKTRAVRAARMDSWHTTDDWPDADPGTLAWLARLNETCAPIETRDGATRLGIGIATGSDAVYLPKVAPDVERSQLVPMVMPDDLRGREFSWSGRYLVSPWTTSGPVDLDEFPLLRRYYLAHSDALRKRSVARRSTAWHRTIDRLNAGLLKQELLVLQDMKAHSNPVRVPAGFYPHHNLTWVSSSEWDLDVLGGLLLSELVERQVAAYCVKMRGGTLRFQPTVLRKVRVPRPKDINPAIAQRLAVAFRERNREAATAAALDAVGLDSLPG